MSKKINNGGAAFPVLDQHAIDGSIVGSREGMTLRDYFAAKMAAAIFSSPSTLAGIAEEIHDANDVDPYAICHSVARGAYAYADAMLEARATNE